MSRRARPVRSIVADRRRRRNGAAEPFASPWLGA
jgi:hypothetical protein